jgi:CubicO group peptidase (beta-lactamase class C family)
MAALAALSLTRDGKLSLDRPVRDYLPWFGFASGGVSNGADVTPRHLLSHTSGVEDGAFDDAHPGAPDLESAVRSISLARPTDLPGAKFHYTDTSYQALGLVMEKAARKSYAALLEERIFKPLAMRSSSALPPSLPPVGSGSFFALPIRRPPASSAFAAPSAYVITTASDMGQYMSFLLGPEKFKRGPVEPRAVSGLFDPLVPGAPYGFGLFLRQEDGSRVAYHDGSLDGFSSRIVLWPEKKRGIAVLAAQSSLLQSLFSLPALTEGARSIMKDGSSARPFPLGRLYILLAVVALVHIFALVVQTGGALHWSKEVRGRAEAKGSKGPLLFAVVRCWLGIALRAAILALCPFLIGLAFGRSISWGLLLQLEPGLAAWFLVACMFGFLRNAARLAWMRGPSGFRLLR